MGLIGRALRRRGFVSAGLRVYAGVGRDPGVGWWRWVWARVGGRWCAVTTMDDEQGQGQAEQGPGAGILHVFGRQLKLCRERAGLDRAELGRTGYSGVDDRVVRAGEADSAAEVHRPGG